MMHVENSFLHRSPSQAGYPLDRGAERSLGTVDYRHWRHRHHRGGFAGVRVSHLGRCAAVLAGRSEFAEIAAAAGREIRRHASEVLAIGVRRASSLGLAAEQKRRPASIPARQRRNDRRNAGREIAVVGSDRGFDCAGWPIGGVRIRRRQSAAGNDSYEFEIISADQAPEGAGKLAEGELRRLNDGSLVTRTEQGELRREKLAVKLQPPLELTGTSPIIKLDHVSRRDGTRVCTLSADGKLRINLLASRTTV